MLLSKSNKGIDIKGYKKKWLCLLHKHVKNLTCELSVTEKKDFFELIISPVPQPMSSAAELALYAKRFTCTSA